MATMELVITDELKAFLMLSCEESIVKPIMDNSLIQREEDANYWNITSLMKNQSIGIKNVDKAQVVSTFILKGGKVELDSPIYNFYEPTVLWEYLKKHGYLQNNELYYLKAHFFSELYHKAADIDMENTPE